MTIDQNVFRKLWYCPQPWRSMKNKQKFLEPKQGRLFSKACELKAQGSVSLQTLYISSNHIR